jgi:glutaredoxin
VVAPASERGGSVVTTLLGAGALVAAAAAVAVGSSAFDDFDFVRGLVSGSAARPRSFEPQPTAMVTQTDPAPELEPSAEPLRAEDSAGDPQPKTAQPPRPDDDAQRAEALRRQRELADEMEAQDRRRKQMIEADWQNRSLEQARQGIVVVMYSTNWCPSCVAARSYMDSHGIAYVDHDIEESESARSIMRRLNPRGSVPTIDVDGEVLVGFGPSHIERALDRAARKRAGI